jgi:hypothetical protein
MNQYIDSHWTEDEASADHTRILDVGEDESTHNLINPAEAHETVVEEDSVVHHEHGIENIEEMEQAKTSYDNSHSLNTPNKKSTIPKLQDPWRPLSLQPAYLITLAVVSFILAIICITMSAVSTSRFGLMNARSSEGFNFSWRFLPTLVSVIYTLLWAPVAADLTRTEAWVLLSLPGGSKASESLFHEEESWATIIVNIFSRMGQCIGSLFDRFIKRKNKSWQPLTTQNAHEKRVKANNRWAIDLAVVASLLASLAINPLSAALFDVEQVAIKGSQPFKTIKAPSGSLQIVDISDSTYITSLASLIYNISTTAWVSDKYAVVPFWPAELVSPPVLASGTTLPAQTWSGNTDVYQLQLQCTPFTSLYQHYSGEPSNATGDYTFNQNTTCSVTTQLPFTSDLDKYIPGGGVWNSYTVSSC